MEFIMEDKFLNKETFINITPWSNHRSELSAKQNAEFRNFPKFNIEKKNPKRCGLLFYGEEATSNFFHCAKIK